MRRIIIIFTIIFAFPVTNVWAADCGYFCAEDGIIGITNHLTCNSYATPDLVVYKCAAQNGTTYACVPNATIIGTGTTTACMCNQNYYQPSSTSDECTQCNPGYSTDTAGKVGESSCRILCNANTYIKNANDATCTPCAVGYSKPGDYYVSQGNTSACDPNYYKITYNAGSGTGTDQIQGVYYNAQFITKPNNTFTPPTGHSLTSWGGSYPGVNAQYQYTTVGNTTLIATYTPNTISITYISDGGGTPPTTPANCLYTGNFTLPTQGTMSKTNYVLGGWKITNGAWVGSPGASIACTNLGVTSGTVSLTAVWQACGKPNAATYNPNTCDIATCVTNYYLNGTGSTATCELCNTPGKYCENSVLKTCEKGYYCNDGKIRRPCPMGRTTSNTGTSTADNCNYTPGDTGTKFCDKNNNCFYLP